MREERSGKADQHPFNVFVSGEAPNRPVELKVDPDGFICGCGFHPFHSSDQLSQFFFTLASQTVPAEA